MTVEEVKYLLKEASEKIKDDFIPNMKNLLMDVFKHGINKGSELGMKVASDASKSKSQSLIKWQTGEPKEGGGYLITTYNGFVLADYWRVFPNRSGWDYRSKFDVVAWCKLSDIEPYKEETK